MKRRKTQEKHVKSREKERKTSRDDKVNNNNNGHKSEKRKFLYGRKKTHKSCLFKREGK